MNPAPVSASPGTHLIARAIAEAPRPFLMPALPASAQEALAQGADMAVAFAMEALRLGAGGDAARDAFLRGLAALVREAAVPGTGDAHFQALVLKADDPAVAEYVRLAAQQHADRRTVRAAIDAFAHPGKLRSMAPGPAHDQLAHLHALSAQGDWVALAQGLANDAIAALATISRTEALQRLLRVRELLSHEAVQRYRDLCEQRGPTAGTLAANAQGRAAARAGEAAERETFAAFDEIAALLNANANPRGGNETWRAIRTLRVPRGFPGDGARAKDEWDAALLHGDRLELLAEVKAAPAAATPDFARLHRGLLRFAQADDAQHTFPALPAPATIAGDSLRALAPEGYTLPPCVIYCCPAPAEAKPAMLAASSKAVLLSEDTCIAYARELASGNTPTTDFLLPVWDALMATTRLRTALHQYDTACKVRNAMLRPRDLLQTLRELSADRSSPR